MTGEAGLPGAKLAAIREASQRAQLKDHEAEIRRWKAYATRWIKRALAAEAALSASDLRAIR